jgi:antirestriction protein ArdC
MSTKRTKTRQAEQRIRGGIYERVTNTLMGLIEGGTLPWRTRWANARPRRQRAKKPPLVPGQRLLLPLSLSSRKPYQGVNVLILWAAAVKLRYASPYWGTLRAWNQLDCRVKVGEKATHIVRWIEKAEVDPETGEEEETTFPVSHAVFNVAQVQGLEKTIAKFGGNEPPLVMVTSQPQAEQASEPESWEPAETVVMVLNPKLSWGGDKACYSLRRDSIRMPERNRFETQAGLYSVLMHEVGHWTGHPKRLDRELTGGVDTPEYWFEELVAELSACFVLAALVLPDRMEELPNAASYLKFYLDLLRDDRRKLVKAAGLAQKAADFILSGGTVTPKARRKRAGSAQGISSSALRAESRM